MRSTSFITCDPNGLTSARCGTFAPIRVKWREIHLGLVGDGQQMQDRVGGTAEGHQHRDRVLESLPVRMSRAVIPRRNMSTTAIPLRRA